MANGKGTKGGGAQPGAGRKQFKPTLEQRKTVEAMVGYGIVLDDIAKVIVNPGTSNPISRKTLSAAFALEIGMGKVKADTAVAQSLFQKATGKGVGAVTAAIWWTKTRMGWRETLATNDEPDNKIEIVGGLPARKKS